MNKIMKARKHTSAILNELLDEVTPLEMEKTKNKMQLAARIAKLIKESGCNKSQFATKLKKNPSEITKWLSGTQNFTVEVLTEIAYTLDCKLSDLTEDDTTNCNKTLTVIGIINPKFQFIPHYNSFINNSKEANYLDQKSQLSLSVEAKIIN